MVTNVTSFGRSGLSDWLVQRVTAIIIAVYVLFIVGYLATADDLSYQQWVALHQGLCVRILSLFAVVSVAAHAWIGLWSVLTDYVTERMMGAKATVIRLLLELGMITVTLVYVVWAFDILWGI